MKNLHGVGCSNVIFHSAGVKPRDINFLRFFCDFFLLPINASEAVFKQLNRKIRIRFRIWIFFVVRRTQRCQFTEQLSAQTIESKKSPKLIVYLRPAFNLKGHWDTYTKSFLIVILAALYSTVCILTARYLSSTSKSLGLANLCFTLSIWRNR